MKNTNKYLIIIGSIIFILGVVFSFLSHNLHNGIISMFHYSDINKVHEHGTHNLHIYTGLIISLLGIALIILGWKILWKTLKIFLISIKM